jgi:hypothetical protein
MAESRTNTAKTERKDNVGTSARPKRKPLVNALNAPMQSLFESYHEKGFKYSAPRIDEQHLIQRMIEAGWEHVKDGGKPVEYKGKSHHVLMRQPMEYWLEDEAIRQKQIDNTERSNLGSEQATYLPGDRKQMIEDERV